MIGRSHRTWIWAAVLVQGAGFVFDVLWHGLLRPDFHAQSVAEMVRHLTTVHLPIYVGAVCVFLATAWALVARMRRSDRGTALPIAFLGACVSLAGEAWHAHSHLQLTTHTGPIAGMTSFLGFIVVVIALLASGRRRQRATEHLDQRRAA